MELDSLCQESIAFRSFSSYYTTLAITICYLVVVMAGPRLLKNREPFSLKPPILMFNLAQILMNSHIIYLCASLLGFKIFDLWTNVCNPVSALNDSPKIDNKVNFVLFYYYVNKIADLLDTIFFILRKKESQVTFLHVFHHTAIVTTSWLSVYVMREELTVHMLSINALIHVIMYSYYLLSSLQVDVKFLWWKKYVTSIQIVQFLLILSMLAKMQLENCSHHPWFVPMWFSVVAAILILFLNFFKKSYSTQKKLKGI